MQIPLQVTFEGTAPSDAVKLLIQREVDRLEMHNNRVTGCRATLIAPSKKHRHGVGFHLHLWITIPPHEEIVVNRPSTDGASHEYAELAVKSAFAAARGQIDGLLVDRRREKIGQLLDTNSETANAQLNAKPPH